jgi:tricorn protease
VTLQPSDDVARLLERTVGKRTVLQVIGEGGQPREVVLRPIGGQEFRDRLYEEEIELRQECVARATGGKVAYIHVRAMDEGSLELFERDLYAEAHGRDALIIDVRNNGGGWTTDLLLTSLSAPDHAVTQARGGGPGYPAGRRLIYAWTKPIVVLCDEYSFSNAEIFSWAIRTIRRGPVVGQQTFGGVISTGGTSLLDGSYLRLPFRGWHSKLDGSNLEGTGCMPDIVVENVPGDLARGVDLQLARAIEEALRQVER